MNKDIIGFIKRKKGEYVLFNSEIDRKVSEEKGDCLQLLLLAHSLEKGSGLPQIKKGFGVEKAKQLLFLLEKYRNNEVKDFALLEGYSALKEYLLFSKKMVWN